MKIYLSFFIGAFIIFGFAGCAENANTIYCTEGDAPVTSLRPAREPVLIDDDLISIPAPAAEPLPLQRPGAVNPPMQTIATGANDFAFRLSAMIAENTGNESFVFSPYSVWLPLAALLNATVYEERDALLEALGASGVTVEDINRAASRMLFDLTNEREREFAAEFGFDFHNPLSIANAVFVDNNVTLRGDFADNFMNYFRGTAMNVDFTSPDAVTAINQWASEHTEGLITEVVQEFDPDTIAAIANAIYFSDRWSWEFDPDETAEGIFHAPTGDVTADFMLREGDMLMYFEDESLQAIQLDFTNAGGMIILLPKCGDATGLMATKTNERFLEIANGLAASSGKLLLPRFSIETMHDGLADLLKDIGVPLFDSASAPLTGGLIYDNIPVWLSSAVQKTVIEVDEEGTTAAAVTVMAMAGSALPEPTTHFEMICDTPFAFVLFRWTFDGGRQVLFTGVVNQP